MLFGDVLKNICYWKATGGVRVGATKSVHSVDYINES